MKKSLLIAIAFSWMLTPALNGQQSPEARLDAIFNPGSSNPIYVSAHRGDWRDAPENSLLSLKWAARLGVDIVEFDLKRTKDGQLVVMHDPTLNRTTTGSGLVSNYTLAELERLHLRAGTSYPTAYTIPTFSEELAAARENKVILDVDQGWNYFPDVLRQVQASHEVGQVIINIFPNTSYATLHQRVGDIPEDVTLMIVVNMARPDADSIIESYKTHKRTIVQCIFADDQAASVQHIPLYRKQFPIWINSLWPNQNANHDDERAVDQGEPDQSWGWLVAHGATILQTDRPRELLEYLDHKGLR